jgi:hypothetical protein
MGEASRALGVAERLSEPREVKGSYSPAMRYQPRPQAQGRLLAAMDEER